MLLRRVMEHVKTQNWTAVCLDFFIVVAGVFVGLQVSNLNEDRKARADERSALMRLQIEAEQVVTYWQEEVHFSRRINENRRVFLEVLEAGIMRSTQQGAVDDAILRMAHYAEFNPPQTVYDELISSGGLALISDLSARNAVSSYAAELNFIEGQLPQFRSSIAVFYRAYEGRIISTYAPERLSLRRFEYNIEELAADRQFASDMVDLTRNQLQFHNYRKRTLQAAIAMCEAVSLALSMVCSTGEIDFEDAAEKDGVNR